MLWTRVLRASKPPFQWKAVVACTYALLPRRITESGKTWFRCPVCVGGEVDSTSKVVLHVNAMADDVLVQLSVKEQHQKLQDDICGYSP